MTLRKQLSMTLICSLCFVLLVTMGAALPRILPRSVADMPPITVHGLLYPDETIYIRSFGFSVGEPVTMSVDGVQLGVATARRALYIINNDLGYIDAPVTLPSTTTPGIHTAQTVGQTTGRVANGTFTVKSD